MKRSVVNPVLNQACSRNTVMPFADLKDRTQRSRCFQNVGTKLSLCELFGAIGVVIFRF